MLSEKEKQMYHSQGKKVNVILTDGSVIEGECSFFTQALDNEPEEASITLANVRKDGVRMFHLTEIMEHEIKSIKYEV